MGACASRSKVLKGETIDAPEPRKEEIVAATEAPEVATVEEPAKELKKGDNEADKDEATSQSEAVEKDESKAESVAVTPESEEKPATVASPATEADAADKEEKKAEVVA